MFIEHFVREMVRADAHAQVLQQTGWAEFQRSMKKPGGIDIAGGVGELAYLGLREVKISFYVEPVQPGFWQRLKRVGLYLLGRQSAPAMQVCRLASDAIESVAPFQITLTVARAADGGFTVKSEHLKSSGEVYVTDILS